MQNKSLLEETQSARREWLCLLSWYNEMSFRHERFEELVYRLMAAEKWYQACLKKLRQEKINCLPLPYSKPNERRGLKINDCWFGW